MRAASAIAGALILAGMASSANAVTFTEAAWGPGLGENNAPTFGAPTPDGSSPNFAQGVTGSILNTTLSPYAYNTDGFAGTAYNVLNSGGGPATSSATYNFAANVTNFTLLWGSPDTYNNVTFYAGADGTGAVLAFGGSVGNEIAGDELACYASTCTHDHWVVVNFTSDTPFGSVVLRDTSQAAFEFGLNDPGGETPTTPLPAAVWLLGSVLAGGAGFGRWRKRKAKIAAA